MVVIFTYFYTAMTVNPNQMADDMKNGGFIPEIKPGKVTTDYLDTIMSKLLYRIFIFRSCSNLPAFAVAGGKYTVCSIYGGTSLLILVGVILDTLQQMKSFINASLRWLMDSGRIKGKSSGNIM